MSSFGVASYAYNNSNELASTPTTSYSYDNNGNTLTKSDSTGTTTYAWDYENRLTSATLPGSGGTISFKYDPFGRRIYKSSSSGTSIFAYDGDNLTEETNSSGTVVARYSQTENTDEPLAMLRSSTTSYYEQDGLSSVTSLSNSAGAQAQTYTFDSFGKLTASSGSLTNPFQFTGREFDSQTMLYFMRARYYSPSIGRFMSEDPIGFIGGPDFYVYVDNSPVTSSDPTGRCKEPCPVPVPAHPPGVDPAANMAQAQQNGIFWWLAMVQNFAPWDYKRQNSGFDDFGNFNFGATGCALGIPLNILQRGAGGFKNLPKFGHWWWRYPYGNEYEKQDQISKGFNYCQKCMAPPSDVPGPFS